jgi:hypothetical protein
MVVGVSEDLCLRRPSIFIVSQQGTYRKQWPGIGSPQLWPSENFLLKPFCFCNRPLDLAERWGG